MNKKLIEKISEIIDLHIEEIVERKIDEILDEILKTKNQQEEFVDLFGISCNIKDVTKDHIMPKSSDGASSKSNILYLCKETNSKKGSNISGEINGIKFKVIEEKNIKLKSGKVGAISIQKKSDQIMKSISTKKENKRFEEFKSRVNNL